MSKLPYLLPLLALLACGTPTTEAPPAPPAKEKPLRDGLHVLRDASGQPTMEGEIKDGKRIGRWIGYGPNGRILSHTEYREGTLEGPTITFRNDGSVFYRGQHHADKKVGTWTFYDEAGRVARTTTFDSTGQEVVQAP